MLDLQGTPRRLYLFQLATSTIPLPNGSLSMSSGCYLIQTTTGQNILIDSGLPPDYVPPPGSPPSENEKNVLAHLTDLGLGPNDVHTVICTHFDIDHVGFHPRSRTPSSSCSGSTTTWRGVAPAFRCRPCLLGRSAAALPVCRWRRRAAIRYLADQDTWPCPSASVGPGAPARDRSSTARYRCRGASAPLHA